MCCLASSNHLVTMGARAVLQQGIVKQVPHLQKQTKGMVQ